MLLKEMEKGLNGKNWKIVTLVRDPIAVNISGFFQIIDHSLPNFEDRYRAGSVSIETATKVFLEKYDHEWPLTWFDIELNSALGIDVYSSHFPQSKGYKIYRTEQVELLVLRLENINECVYEAFNEFLGLEQFSLVKANVGSKKTYSTAYKKFKDSIALPESYINKMYSSKHARHFYSEAEIADFKARWMA